MQNKSPNLFVEFKIIPLNKHSSKIAGKAQIMIKQRIKSPKLFLGNTISCASYPKPDKNSINKSFNPDKPKRDPKSTNIANK